MNEILEAEKEFVNLLKFKNDPELLKAYGKFSRLINELLDSALGELNEIKNRK